MKTLRAALVIAVLTPTGLLGVGCGCTKSKVGTTFTYSVASATNDDAARPRPKPKPCKSKKQRPDESNSKKNSGGGKFDSRDEALDAARQDRRDFPNTRTEIREECRKGGHVHLDIYNGKGKIIETRHYDYPSKCK